MKIWKIITAILKILKKLVKLKKYIKFGNIWTEITEQTDVNPFEKDKNGYKKNMENRKYNNRCRNGRSDKPKRNKK